jgi:predicted phosphodiesterase
MKIAVCSDTHLEFADLDLKNEEQADVLVLAGDICVAGELPYSDSKYGERFKNFFSHCSLEFPHVVMIAGNHESYNGDIAMTNRLQKEATAHLSNFHVLEKETFVLDDVTFIGGTLWTDMNGGDEMTLYHVGRCMNDFRLIENSNSMVSYKTFQPDPKDGTKILVTFKERPSIFSTQDAYDEHKKTVGYIDSVVNGKTDQKFVVIGHHAPSKKSTKPQYENDTLMNGGYSSNLDFFIEDRPQIKVWFHGHTHHSFDYMVGQTRIVCNPRGYKGYEEQAETFKLKYIEV